MADQKAKDPKIPPPKSRQEQARQWNSGIDAALHQFGLIDEEMAAMHRLTPDDFEGPDEEDADKKAD